MNQRLQELEKLVKSEKIDHENQKQLLENLEKK